MNPSRNPAWLLAGLAVSLVSAQNANQPEPSILSRALNRDLPSWLHVGGEERARVESLSGVGFRAISDAYLLNRFRLDLEIRPRPWLKFGAEGEDSRVFGQNTLPAPASQKDAFDLRLGYVKVGSEEGALTLTAGRQPLYFGEGRLLADPAWSNVGRSFDAARLTLRHGSVSVDLFTGSTVKTAQLDFDLPTTGEHIHGAYGSLRRVVPGATIEPFVIWRLEHNCRSEGGQPGNLDEKTFGLRWVGKLPWGVDYGVEVARQSGSVAGDRVHSWAGHWTLGHTLPNPRLRPRFFTELNRASGDANPGDGRRGGFDPLFPSTHDKLGLSDLFTWTNLLHWRTGFGVALRPNVTVATAFNSFWLADTTDGVYVGGKQVARSATGSAGSLIGRQADLQATWTLSRSTQVGAGYARLFPGSFLRRMTSGLPYQIVFCNVAQRF